MGGEALGFFAGMFFHPVSKNPITGEFEILLSRKGNQYFGSTYLDIPILINVKIAKKFFFGGGGFSGFNIGSLDDAHFQFVDRGYILEMGYWKDRIELGLRFEKSISHSFSLDFLKYQNRVWGIYLGYHL
jgi:hypothetical protein